jgi:hypothetical protein
MNGMPDSARFAVAVALWAAAVFACAALSGRERTREHARVFGLVALLASLVAPPAWLAARAVLTGFGVLALGRAHDLVRRPEGLSFWGRVWLMTAIFDVRGAEARSPGLDRGEARWLAVHLVAFRLAWLAVFRLAPQLDGLEYWALRWGCGLIACYALIESVHSLLLLAYRGFGVGLPRINVYPIASRTLAEFWGRRWNRVVSGWLSDNFFMPLARRRHPILGTCAAFAGSTALHFWLAWVPLDLAAGAMMASYFVIHGVGLLLERALGVSRWTPGAQRAWTAVWLVGPSPLFIEPALRMLAGFVGG